MQTFSFTLESIDQDARAGIIETPHGIIHTPVFMPVGTQGSVKGLTREMVRLTGSEIMLCNTYHLYLEPGHEVIRDFSSIHAFMANTLPVLTDSGGFQVFSLGAQIEEREHNSAQGLVQITEEGVHFRSHRDGSKHFFSPEFVMEIEDAIGADIIMAFDECASGSSTYQYAKAAMERTHRWGLRSRERWMALALERQARGLHAQALFGIMQGVIYEDLRKESCQYITSLDTPGVAIGGLSVGESKHDMYRILDVLAPLLPVEKPHYLMGVGTPEDIIEGISRGIDMFDCALPTRLARHGVAFSSHGKCKITNAKYRLEQGGIPCVPELATMVSATYSLGYLRHLYQVEEMLAGILVSMHNIEFLQNITHMAREAIINGKFLEWKKWFYENNAVSMER